MANNPKTGLPIISVRAAAELLISGFPDWETDEEGTPANVQAAVHHISAHVSHGNRFLVSYIWWDDFVSFIEHDAAVFIGPRGQKRLDTSAQVG